jgi:hypothetical protein
MTTRAFTEATVVTRTRFTERRFADRRLSYQTCSASKEELRLELEEIELHLSVMRAGYQQCKLSKCSVLFLMKEIAEHVDRAKNILH